MTIPTQLSLRRLLDRWSGGWREGTRTPPCKLTAPSADAFVSIRPRLSAECASRPHTWWGVLTPQRSGNP
jgi:hypothetical protein